MKAMLKIFLMFACSTLLLANAPEKSSYDTQVKILKELDIDASFMKTSHYAKMRQGIKESQLRTFTDALKNGYMYIPMVKEQIKKSGVPESFFLPSDDRVWLFKSHSIKRKSYWYVAVYGANG